MANVDIETVVQDLNRRFAEPLPEFYNRRIIFWYDEDKEFEDKVDDVVLSNATLVKLTGTNNFAVKSCFATMISRAIMWCTVRFPMQSRMITGSLEWSSIAKSIVPTSIPSG